MFRAAVVGLGNIGLGLDVNLSARRFVLTHAQGFHSHQDFKLVAGVDSNPARRKAFEKKYRVPAYPNIRIMARTSPVDVAAVALPPEMHVQAVRELLPTVSRALICEKPLGRSLREAEQIVQMAARKRLPLLVNFMRRFEPGVVAVKKLLDRNVLGSVYKAVVWYSKGIVNNGSHFVDLMEYWLGPASRVQLMGSKNIAYEGDPEPDVKIKFGNTDVFFISAREKYFSVREIELLGSKGAISYYRGGTKILHHDIERSRIYKGYNFLSESARVIKNDLQRSQWHVLEALSQHLKRGNPLASTGTTALKALKICYQIKKNVA